jgi:hypothetical protein
MTISGRQWQKSMFDRSGLHHCHPGASPQIRLSAGRDPWGCGFRQFPLAQRQFASLSSWRKPGSMGAWDIRLPRSIQPPTCPKSGCWIKSSMTIMGRQWQERRFWQSSFFHCHPGARQDPWGCGFRQFPLAQRQFASLSSWRKPGSMGGMGSSLHEVEPRPRQL